eukprot:11208151-Lingulodinium_polyedra.AAC.1
MGRGRFDAGRIQPPFDDSRPRGARGMAARAGPGAFPLRTVCLVSRQTSCSVWPRSALVILARAARRDVGQDGGV